MLVRGSELRASNAMQDRVEAHKKINVMYGTTVEDAYGDGRGLTGLHLHHAPSGRPHSLTALLHAACLLPSIHVHVSCDFRRSALMP